MPSTPSILPLECEIQRRGAEHHQKTEASPPGSVDRFEAGVLTGPKHNLVRLPKERVVHAQAMRAGWQIVRDHFTMLQYGDLLVIDRYIDLPDAGIIRRLS